MRSIKMIIGLAAAACLLAVVSAQAVAAPSWYEKGEKLTKSVGSTSEGELELEDSKTAVGAVRLKCKIKSTGTVGPNGADSINAAELKECKVVKGSCGSPKAEAVHLPWSTELKEEAGGEIRDGIKNSGAGLPGYKVTCIVIVKIEDTCEGETSTGMANNLGEGLVEAKFDAKSAKAKCTQSKGAVTGTVEGVLKIKSNAGGALSVK